MQGQNSQRKNSDLLKKLTYRPNNFTLLKVTSRSAIELQMRHALCLLAEERNKHILHSTKDKPKTSQAVYDRLRQLLYLEYEFYDFVRALISKRKEYLRFQNYKYFLYDQ